MGWKGEERLVHVAAGPVTLAGNLSLPEGARGVVLFAHGRGSSTGAALMAAVERPDVVGAVVSRGGRPDHRGVPRRIYRDLGHADAHRDCGGGRSVDDHSQ